MLIAAALLLVAQSASATQASYQINALKDRQAHLLAEQDQLQSQLAQIRAPSRVASVALTLGMGQPARWQYVTGSPSPIALAPRHAADGQRGVLGGVLAVVGTLVGRFGDGQASTP
ncbi:MAG TPA: hypothetical protein VET65_03610 [Candidatus Limnocylindrales bacterium]|nr:hypothetical protein [Candidatus Limnocylindrales bacterium]